MSEPKGEIDHFSITLDGFDRLIAAIQELPFKVAAPIMDGLQKNVRAVFKADVAKIVPDPPPAEPPGQDVENKDQGGA